MQYIDHTRPQRQTSRNQTTFSHPIYRMAKHNRHATHNHNSKGTEIRLGIAAKEFIESDQ